MLLFKTTEVSFRVKTVSLAPQTLQTTVIVKSHVMETYTFYLFKCHALVPVAAESEGGFYTSYNFTAFFDQMVSNAHCKVVSACLFCFLVQRAGEMAQ